MRRRFCPFWTSLVDKGPNDKVAGPDKGPAEDPDGQAILDLGRINNDDLRVPAELFPIAAGSLGNLLRQRATPVRVKPEKPRNHQPSSLICSS